MSSLEWIVFPMAEWILKGIILTVGESSFTSLLRGNILGWLRYAFGSTSSFSYGDFMELCHSFY